jgi:hypothetical protein
LGERCFSWCESLSSIMFESESRLSRIDKMAFYWSGLVGIILPASIEILGEECFSSCESLSSIYIWIRVKISRKWKRDSQSGWMDRQECSSGGLGGQKCLDLSFGFQKFE